MQNEKLANRIFEANEPYRQPASIARKIASGRLRVPELPEVEAKLRSGDYQCLSFPLGFVITEIKEYDFGRILRVHLLGGERFDEWKAELVGELVKFARGHGCSAIEATCRLGLEESLKPLGFRRSRVVLRREV